MNRRIQTLVILLVILFTTGCGGGNDKAKNDAKDPDRFIDTNNTQIIENAEDGKSNRWKIAYDKSNKAKIRNIYDDEKESNVIFLDGNERETGFILSQSLNDKESKVVQWSMKTDENFVVRIIVDTHKGMRSLEYHGKDSGTGYKKYIFDNNKTVHMTNHGIGSTAANNEWHTYIRDINTDLKRYEKDNELKSIKSIFFRGKLKIDDIIFHSSTKNLKIDKSVSVMAPGVVLTFDDSYVENWKKIMPYFEENGVVATFFCHKWGSTKKGDLTEAEVAELKLFEADGHEIGYHTKDHESTRDTKYDEYITIENKANAYFEDQIESGVHNMRERGFEPGSFSYPYLTGTHTHNKIIRKTLPHIREFFAHVILIDEKVEGSKTIDEIKLHLDKFKKDKEIGVLVGHLIAMPEKTTDQTYQTTLDRLMTIVEYAKSIGLKFYTIEEAHKIYLNQ